MNITIQYCNGFTSAGNLWFSAVSSALNALTRAGLGITNKRLEMFSKVSMNCTYDVVNRSTALARLQLTSDLQY